MNGKSLTGSGEYSRVMWQCRRGMLELDILLQGFVRRYYSQLDQQARDAFLELLQYPDPELYELIMEHDRLTEEPYASILDKIRRSA